MDVAKDYSAGIVEIEQQQVTPIKQALYLNDAENIRALFDVEYEQDQDFF